MDPLGLVPLARTLVDIDSTTGQEADCGRWLAAYLRGRGFLVEEQPVEGDRFNVLASLEPPRVVFSTHFDCVPPFFPSREADGLLHGRGSCDAKGILAAQICALERLRAPGTSGGCSSSGKNGAAMARAWPTPCRTHAGSSSMESRRTAGSVRPRAATFA